MRIASFNVQHGRTAAGAVATRVLAEYCASLRADLLALQEVDVGVPRSGRVDQAAVVAQAAAMRCVFGQACRVALVGRYGNALLARGELSDVEVLALPHLVRGERRSAVLATARVGATALSVAATHLSIERAEALEQLDAVLGALAGRPHPLVAVGDWNLGAADVAPVLERHGLELADPRVATFPADAPRARIDHVAVAGLEVLAVAVEAAPPVSDHRALVVEVAPS